MMHPDKRQTIILALAVAIIAGGLLAWRFNLTPEIGRFFAANTERCNALLETANKDAYDDCVRSIVGEDDWNNCDAIGGTFNSAGLCEVDVPTDSREDCNEVSGIWNAENQTCHLVEIPEGNPEDEDATDCNATGGRINEYGLCEVDIPVGDVPNEEDFCINELHGTLNPDGTCHLVEDDGEGVTPESCYSIGGTFNSAGLCEVDVPVGDVPNENFCTEMQGTLNPDGTCHLVEGSSTLGAGGESKFWFSKQPTGSNDGYTESPTGNIPANSIFGWAFDPDESAKSIDVHVYFDGGPGCTSCTAIAANAGLERPDVNDVFSINGNHGFAVAVPGQYRDGKEHTANAYGIDSAGNGNLNSFIGTKTFTATIPKPMCTPAACANPPDGCSYQGGDSCNCGLLVCETELPPPPLCTPAACPNPPNGCSYQRSADGCQCGELICIVLPPPGEHQAGDTNGDGKVNIFDYNLVVTNFGATTSQGDATGDGKVDIFDYNAVVSNFGK